MISKDIYAFFSDLILKTTGMVYSEKEYYRLERRLNNLAMTYTDGDVGKLKELYMQPMTATLKTALIDITTNAESFFFRDTKAFKALAQEVVPKILEKQNTLSIWCAGCSTGQEPYSILMQLMNKIPDFNKVLLTLKATDINSQSLEKCRAGVYEPLEVQRGLPTKHLTKFFTQLEDEKWEISRDLRQKIRFDEFNLFSDHFPLNTYNIIFCRNVLIYQNNENREKIINRFYESLLPGGVLFMGCGESLLGLKTPFKSQTTEGFIYFVKEA